MSKPVFVYVACIASSLDKVFKAPTSHETTGKFWFGNSVTSDWTVDSPLEFHREDKLILRGTVLENDPPRGGRRINRCGPRAGLDHSYLKY